MKKITVWGFPRTIYELGKVSKGFLDPWTSLKPSFLRKKIASDIWGVFGLRGGKLTFDSYFKVKGKSVDFPRLNNRWALVFPKRTYLPPEFPHFQFWLLSRNFVPSPKFLNGKELLELEKIVELFFELYEQYSVKKGIKGKAAFGFNSTTFSFIKDEGGRYYSGGQSVRVFHLHALLIPKPKKLEVPQRDLSLVYPTDFSRALFGLIFLNRKIQKKLKIASKTKVIRAKRGVKIEKPLKEKNLGKIMVEIDRLMYQLQKILTRSFYLDTDRFISHLDDIEKLKDIKTAEKKIKELIVVGKERPIKDIKSILIGQLEDLARKYNSKFESIDLLKLADKLELDKNGDLCSRVFGKLVVLRPGMGYGVLMEKSGEKMIVRINPLDVMRVKGLIESSGYWFEKKIIKTEYPDWAVSLITSLIKKTVK